MEVLFSIKPLKNLMIFNLKYGGFLREKQVQNFKQENKIFKIWKLHY